MRSRIRATGTVLCVCLLAMSAASSVSAGASGNTYDKFRNAKYSNNGLMSQQDELRLGNQVHNEILNKSRVVNDPEISNYLQSLGERLVRSSKRSDIQYRFYAIDDQSVNAFAIPGGYVYVHTGLLNMVRSEDELAGAIAHEIGHVVARHGLKNVKKAQQMSILSGIIGIGAAIATGEGGAGRAAKAATDLVASGVITRNSRDFEREADFLGLYTMTAAGYDPDAMVRLFQRLEQSSVGSKDAATGGIFASHPNAVERIANTQSEIQTAGLTASTTAANTVRVAQRGRTRRTTQQPSSFDSMKQALSAYASGGSRGYGNTNSSHQNYPQQPYPNDPNNEPVRNDRPVLTRRP